MSRHVVLCPDCVSVIEFEWEGDQPVKKVKCGKCMMPFNIEEAERYFELLRSGITFTEKEFMDYFNIERIRSPTPKTKKYREYLWEWMTRPTLVSIHILISVLCGLNMKIYFGLPLILIWVFGMPWAIMSGDKNRTLHRTTKVKK